MNRAPYHKTGLLISKAGFLLDRRTSLADACQLVLLDGAGLLHVKHGKVGGLFDLATEPGRVVEINRVNSGPEGEG